MKTGGSPNSQKSSGRIKMISPNKVNEGRISGFVSIQITYIEVSIAQLS